MTAILKDLRELDARLSRGEITDVEYIARRSALIDSIDVVETEFVAHETPADPPDTKLPGPMKWGFGIVVCLGIIGVCLCFAMLIFGDMNLALTLGVTILAALTVALFRSLEE
ncbi:SHOCT domain-containing protein [Roseobacter sinensis]|uniref:SHOCT domain-containing protein n=1 Tax=Roseobacter sinensis TaxID=2931391 RepID=A0ABT3B9R5_9RHOB|nr:SHOCT domain-containing protein [Roseobacter sp. WL0113]MCV3270313.1 SHOCT domain-containing protein [Roseobacter sp. WL0113]